MEPEKAQLLGLTIAIDEIYNMQITPESSSAFLWPWRRMWIIFLVAPTGGIGVFDWKSQRITPRAL